MATMNDDSQSSVIVPDSDQHIVDVLIEERAVELKETAAWPLVRAVFYPLLGYRKAVAMADAIGTLTSGREAMDWAERFLNMSIEVTGRESIPKDGPCIITANHPGGIADGVAVWQALKEHRPDMAFYANRDAIRINPHLIDHVIPVEWREKFRSRDKTRETLVQTRKALEEGRCVVIFPAGRMSVWSWQDLTLRETDWMPSAAGLVLKYKVPVIPLGVRQRMSTLFYTLGQIHSELKHMTVFHELLAKKKAHYKLVLGEAIEASALPETDRQATAQLKALSESLAGRINPEGK